MKDTFSKDGLKKKGSSVGDIIKGNSSLKAEKGCFLLKKRKCLSALCCLGDQESPARC